MIDLDSGIALTFHRCGCWRTKSSLLGGIEDREFSCGGSEPFALAQLRLVTLASELLLGRMTKAAVVFTASGIDVYSLEFTCTDLDESELSIATHNHLLNHCGRVIIADGRQDLQLVVLLLLTLFNP
jgi:hypothetical protein